MKEQTPAAPANNPKPPKARSPNNPSLNLAEAVAKLPQCFVAMKRHPIGVETAVMAMGYKFTGSTGKLALGAMRSFGLFEDSGKGMVKLSQRALDIAQDFKAGDPEWLAAVKAAALEPKYHKILWDRFHAELPSDDEIRRFLVREHKFYDNAVGDVIEEYKATIAFAKLSSDDTMDDESEDDETNFGNRSLLDTDFSNLFGDKDKKPPKTKGATSKRTTTMRDLPITLPSLQVAVLRVPFPMSDADYLALTNSLTAFKGALVQGQPGDESDEDDANGEA